MTSRRSGFTLIELLVVVAIIGIIAATALPGLLRARMSGNEASAIGSLRAIYSGEQAFSASCGYNRFSPSLQNLGAAIGLAPGFISADLSAPAPVAKSGYLFNLGSALPAPGVSCNGGTLAASYQATADPQAGMGRRYFGTNSGGTIFESTASLAGVMPENGAPAAPAGPLR